MSKSTRSFTFDLVGPADGEAVPAVLSTEAPVKRGQFQEILLHGAANVDLSRFPLPLLVSHDQAMLPVGVAEAPQLIGGKLRAVIKFGASDLAKQVLRDVRNRILRSLSIGYEITVDEVIGSTVRAIRWMPYECSIVPIPADVGAGFFRSHQPETTTMDETSEAQAFDETAVRRQERTRAAAIGDAVRAAKLSPEFARSLVASDLTVDAARAAVIKEWARRTDETATASRISGGEGYGGIGRDGMREAATDALLIRSGAKVEAPHPQARNLASTSLVDIARMFLRESGDLLQAGRPAQLLQRAMTTSDFPHVLEAVADKHVLGAFYAAPPTHFSWSVQRNAQFFRPQNFAGLEDAPALERVLEGGEYTEGALFDRKEQVPLLKYGKIVSLSWEALASDDLSVFTDVASQMAVSARSVLADYAYTLLESNPTMNDSTALFAESRGNLATSGGDPTVETVDTARQALRAMKGSNGNYRDMNPRILLVPEHLRSTAEALLSPFVPNSVDEIRPLWTQQLQVISDPRLADDAWYLFADLTQPAFVRLTLGDRQIETFRDEGFDVDGTRFKIRCVFGFGAVDPQCAYKNPGAGS